MKLLTSLHCACLTLLLCSFCAGAANVYKYRMPGGSTLYSQKPQSKGRLITVLQVQDPTPTSASLRRIEDERRHAKELYDQILESRRVNLLSSAQQFGAGCSDACALALLPDRFLAPLPGERTGTVSGRSRLNDHYWERLRAYPSLLPCELHCAN